MKKMFDERGFLTKEGEKSVEVSNFRNAVEQCFEGMSIHDVQIMASILHKIVGDMAFDKAQNIRNETNKLNAMSDEEFEKYLADKYLPLFGEKWVMKASLTEEEGERHSKIVAKKIEAAFDEMKKEAANRKRHYTGISPRFRGRGRYID